MLDRNLQFLVLFGLDCELILALFYSPVMLSLAKELKHSITWYYVSTAIIYRRCGIKSQTCTHGFRIAIPHCKRRFSWLGFCPLYTANSSALVVRLTGGVTKWRQKRKWDFSRSHVTHCFQKGSLKAEARTGVTKLNRKFKESRGPCSLAVPCNACWIST